MRRGISCWQVRLQQFVNNSAPAVPILRAPIPVLDHSSISVTKMASCVRLRRFACSRKWASFLRRTVANHERRKANAAKTMKYGRVSGYDVEPV